MTTPNQPNDERQQTNGVTERIAPSPIPPRPIQQPGGSAENEPSRDGQSGGNPAGGAPEAPQGQGSDPAGISAPEPGPGDGRTGGNGGGQQSMGGDRPHPGPESGPGQPVGDGRTPADQTTARMNAGAPQGGSNGNGGGQSRYQEGWSQLPQREPQSNLQRPGHTPVSGARPQSNPVGLGGGLTNARTTADLAAKAARKEAAMVKSVGLDGPTRSIARPELVKDMPDLSEIRHPLPQETPGPGPQGPISPAVPVAVAQASASGEPLRATVQVRRIDPWSTLKITLVISVAMFFVWMLAVGLLYLVLEGMGVWERLNTTFTEMVSQDSGSAGLVDAGAVFGYAGVIGLINVVLFTALATVGTFIYNQCCDMVGGIQVTLADPD